MRLTVGLGISLPTAAMDLAVTHSWRCWDGFHVSSFLL